ncbi:ECF transporter S component [Lactococcus termiticola]|uniref:Riboflavin transporter n=1 Tax=Lactococcus termiticola TaxID=2169526 RepID=A0A2R5HGL1_9LACT|nr:ECF transporter S component [Lactococcus termiticola]GBG97197.1 membrane protein [Lactococcus termiticola]
MSKTRRMTLIAVLSAVSVILSQFPQFPLLPGVDFLKIDFSLIPILIGLFILGRLRDGFWILIVRTLAWLFFFNQGVTTIIGLPMNFIAVTVFMVIIWFFLKKDFSMKKYILSGLLATIALTAVMFLLNAVYAIPAYVAFAHYPAEMLGLGNYLLAAILPFNLIEGVIFTLAFGAVYWALRGAKAVKFVNA